MLYKGKLFSVFVKVVEVYSLQIIMKQKQFKCLLQNNSKHKAAI